MPRLPELVAGDCRESMAAMAMSGMLFDACITDPPYGLVSTVERFGKSPRNPATIGPGPFGRTSRGFMGQMWDGTGIAFDPETWRRAFDVLKPGAHLVAFGGSRTFHRMACAIEDAGFEIRDTLMWIYGTGFPKSHDVAKGIDKHLGGEPRVTGTGSSGKTRAVLNAALHPESFGGDHAITTPDTLEAAIWSGWGTSLKPAFEPIILARKPLDGTVAGNTLKHGVGGINIDGCRVGTDGGTTKAARTYDSKTVAAFGDGLNGSYGVPTGMGRHPANVLHDGSDEVVSCFPDSAGQLARARTDGEPKGNKIYGAGNHGTRHPEPRGDSGSAARFFTNTRDGEASADRRYTDNGSTNFAATPGQRREPVDNPSRLFYSSKATKADRAGSGHPTVKPIALMRWLCRLVTPPGGRILDPFAGSGTTLEAAYREGFDAWGCEMEPQYCLDIMNRLAAL